MAGKPDREWEHWPSRRAGEERRRLGLRGLFTPTEPAVEQLVDERSRELEERSLELLSSVADLERREQEALRLRASVEEMLRQGSSELDARHAELLAHAARLREREARAEAAEREVAERRQELGAVELLRAAVERREAAVAEREVALAELARQVADRERALVEAERRVAELVARESELTARESALAGRAEEIEATGIAFEGQRQQLVADRNVLTAAQASLAERERRLESLEADRRAVERRAAELEVGLAQLEADREALESGRAELGRAASAVTSGLGLSPGAAPGPPAPESHLLFLPGERYRLEEVSGPPPEAGTEVTLEGLHYRVLRVGLLGPPGERRHCAYVEPSSSGS